MSYNDLYIRAQLDDSGIIPRSYHGLCHSPDIIPFGIMPVDDPAKFFTSHFGEVLGKDLVYDAANYIYLRGVNYFNGPRSGEAYVYYAPSSLLLHPNQWRHNALRTSTGMDHVSVAADKHLKPYVTPEPFVWIPDYPPPNSHYCLIGRVSTASNPNVIPASLSGFSSFAEWVAVNGGIGWNNVKVVAADSPEFTIAANYDQEEEPGLMDILVTAVDAPVGSEVWFSSGTPLENGEVIRIPPSAITAHGGRRQTFGTQAYIPSFWQTTFNLAYRNNGKGTAGPLFEITWKVVFTAPASHRLYKLGMPIDQLGLGTFLMHDRVKESWSLAVDHYRSVEKTFADVPISPIVLGAFSATSSGQPGYSEPNNM